VPIKKNNINYFEKLQIFNSFYNLNINLNLKLKLKILKSKLILKLKINWFFNKPLVNLIKYLLNFIFFIIINFLLTNI
jgi:hypothetical protein